MKKLISVVVNGFASSAQAHDFLDWLSDYGVDLAAVHLQQNFEQFVAPDPTAGPQRPDEFFLVDRTTPPTNQTVETDERVEHRLNLTLVENPTPDDVYALDMDLQHALELR